MKTASSFAPSSTQRAASMAARKRELLRMFDYRFQNTPIDLIEPIKRDIRCFVSDPILYDPRGLEIAEDAGRTVHALVSSLIPLPLPGQIRIFCSKLRRCVQTAIPLARQLGLPIVLSTGLAQFIVLVRRQKGHFQFVPIPEWQMLYPDITFIDGDLDLVETMNMPAIPVDDWWRCLDMITTNPPLAADSLRRVDIIVAHRETIKELAGKDGALPYCAIAWYDTRIFRPRSAHVIQAQTAEETESNAATAAEEEKEKPDTQNAPELEPAKEAESVTAESVSFRLPLIQSLSNMLSSSRSNSSISRAQPQQPPPTSKPPATVAVSADGDNSSEKQKLKRAKKKKARPIYEEICPLIKIWDYTGQMIYPSHP